MKSRNIVVLLSLLALASCGGNSGGGGGATPPVMNDGEINRSPDSGTTTTPGTDTEREEETRVETDLEAAKSGTYYAVPRPVNFHANGFIPYGAATFTVNGDQLQVSTSMDDDQQVPHRQTLHIGTRCPTLADDKNADGFIDYDEAMSVVGSALMPLDNDLNSQSGGAEVYPKGKAMTYNKLASLAMVNADLWKADENPSDNIMKLKSGQGIGFEGRVVLAHGTTPNSFPSSLASYPGEQPHLSLPVVCGVLKKID